MFVARFTTRPVADAARNWSAWGGTWTERELGVILAALEHANYAAYESISEMIEDFDAACEDEEIMDKARDAAEGAGIVVCQDRENKQWALWHHDGLSCYRLAAKTIEEAIKEAASGSKNKKWDCTFGDHTVGAVRYVAAVPGVENLHVFECDDCSVEV